ncbi:DUF4253 domain-containing protein [Kineosporia succinea]|uniref:DUF4253 domain-containing protein n=1 Tax=Kineosporia succinea TaxID=84632 RepID=A0ABT9PEL4_9ACTN|nr:DUF4253 domain-containing protein [Kineosporia succinea]MDP9831144.1 hypothetical protein [Kineosporia succinea]
MPTTPGLPPELQELFDRSDASRSLTVVLPPGRTVRGDGTPALWLSDDPATLDLWRSFRAEEPHSGLTPLLLDHLDGDPARPWDDGELWPGDMSSPGEHDPAEVLAEWWDEHTERDEDDDLTPDERLEVTAPFGDRWPGLAPRRNGAVEPEEQADRCAARVLREKPHLRLGLVAARGGSDALTAAGWQGAVNYVNDTAMISAVLRSWEERFGARVIAVGFADLYVSVAAPPATKDEALRVAAEHFAFCPDNVWATSLAEYADDLLGDPVWRFWWD